MIMTKLTYIRHIIDLISEQISADKSQHLKQVRIYKR